jgi:hypothetical protein
VTAFAHFDEYVRIDRLEAFLNKFNQLIIQWTYYGYENDNENSDQWEWYDDESENEDDGLDDNDKIDDGNIG